MKISFFRNRLGHLIEFIDDYSNSNLCLPICPKCNDTKYVKREPVKCIAHATSHSCSKCKLIWDGMNL